MYIECLFRRKETKEKDFFSLKINKGERNNEKRVWTGEKKQNKTKQKLPAHSRGKVKIGVYVPDVS